MVVPIASLSWVPARGSRKRCRSATVAVGRLLHFLLSSSRCSDLPSAAIRLDSWYKRLSPTSGPGVALRRGEADAEEADDPGQDTNAR